MSGVYLDRLMTVINNGLVDRASITHAKVYHDDWCKSYKGEACNCDPDIKLGSLWVTKEGTLSNKRSK